MPPGEPTPTEQSRSQAREFRRIIANAVAAVRSEEIRNAFASISLEELVDQHIATLEGTADATVPSRVVRIRRIQSQLADSIEGIKGVPPEAFRRHDPQEDANTDVEPAPDVGTAPTGTP